MFRHKGSGKLEGVRLLYLLIKRSGAIFAASHFTALSLFSSYVIAHERTALGQSYIPTNQQPVEGEPYHLPLRVSDFHENWAIEIRAIRSEAFVS